MSCSVARSLELLGDWWTLLIVREAFYGSRRFGEFESHLGIAPNILSKRLAGLVEAGILHVAAESASGKALEYRLTAEGLDLFPVIVALAQWGDKHAAAPQGPPVRIVEKRSGKEIQPLVPRSASGRPLRWHDVTVVTTPGASDGLRARLEAAAARERAR